MKWLSWPSTSVTKKFQLKVQGIKLQGFDLQDAESARDKVMVLKMKLQRLCKSRFLSFHRTKRKFSSEVFLTNGKSVQWNQEFDTSCSFSVSSKDHSLLPCLVSFSILYGESRESKAKLAVLGKVCLNLAELSPKTEVETELKLPISLQIAGVAVAASLSVSVSFIEVDSIQLGRESTGSDREDEFSRRVKEGKMSQKEPGRIDDLDDSALFESADSSYSTESGFSTSSDTSPEPVEKAGFLSWKRRRLSFTPSTKKGEPLITKTDGVRNGNGTVVDSITSGSARKTDCWKPTSESDCLNQKCSKDRWEVKEVVSRDGQAKLKASVFFASFDQCSERAAGESACAALAAVVAHWLHSNQYTMPTRSQLDNLIKQGSLEWRRLCDNDIHRNLFPDKHFDLETVLQADLRPLAVSNDKSFVGFFSAEKFESLKGTKSFDEIWKEINGESTDYKPRVYIVSWNDHFFVLKVEAQACYIIDSLGKRLFEGCSRAYILKFDHTTIMYGKAKKAGPMAANNEEAEIICRGKECCREFIKRFLAAIPVGELEVQEKKGRVSNLSLLRRLQIDFHFTSSSSSSSSSSPSSSTPATSSTSSLSPNEESIYLR